MDAIKCIMTRRSIRKYSDKKVPSAIVKKILSSAMQAPSAMNEQPWEFITITDQEVLSKVPAVSVWAQMAAKAPLVIVVCINHKRENMLAKGYGIQDCFAATQNILLASHSLGLGAVWCACAPDEKKMQKMREIIGIPAHVDPLCIIPIGYPAEKKNPEKRFKQDRVHENKW
ncbi:MAG: nitroreductase family protein [archaeon]